MTANFLATVGVSPILGRDFRTEADRPGGDRVVLISHGLWKRRFGGDAPLVGRTLALNGESHTVVGILRANFVFCSSRSSSHPSSRRPTTMATST